MKFVASSLVVLFSTANAFAPITTPTRATRSSELHAKADEKRVVVSGLGVISGCGIGHEDFFQACLDGKSSLDVVKRFDPEFYPCKIGSEVPDSMFNANDHFDNPKNAKSNDRYTHFAVAAARLALKDGGVGDTPDTLENAERIGVMVGTAFGGAETFERETLKLAKKPERPRVSPFTIPALLGNTASGVIGIECGCKGPNYGVTSACASGSHAIGEAMGMIVDGHADMMIAGGAEATITPLIYAGFSSMKAMNTKFNDDPKKGSRPFDKDRGGFIMGEGAGVVLIESLESAKKRGAKIYCELVGYGATCDAHHITTPAPGGRGLAAAMEMAIDMSEMDKNDINYINAHGTSTAYNDKFETMAIKTVFGDHATEKDGTFVVSSTKCVTGHTLGAAGGIEAVVAARSIHDNIVPPTINLETPDPECDLDYVPNEKREMEVNGAMSTNLGFGGHNAAILFKKYVE
uniref:3-oxoacyl-[acyl-carrier-protein] synthase n=1 Tax=Chaetoceros debilis TaxID=122233 RepID=A0A7S3V5J2_9STRA|mmetsp:Transcript_22885/g.34907  ORF Transcript_22885/g.34907 Transcript_22885/m.34907 type:complete len:463 (+) Transcript_22885:68-1456(+)|eukprot:CAMPEP_0194084400 /NCGR_PEP_ID=MMETSP0149-20130528/13124_1 /TAXON_ID=122233 /ORGANISM="Chaetoceros debilis, Strain MM31A-1" /LENGTH=462 /DNA_ID=CAMNT_0038767045 /DNA_START=183 /DNA_END=1571 /DNA_ORIENTATION=-